MSVLLSIASIIPQRTHLDFNFRGLAKDLADIAIDLAFKGGQHVLDWTRLDRAALFAVATCRHKIIFFELP